MGDDTNESRLSRRQLIAGGAAGWATVGLAGCSRILDPGPPGGDDDNGNGGTATRSPSGNTTVTNETTRTGDPVSGTATEDGTPAGGGTTTGGGSCASSRRFISGMDVGLHVEVFDDLTGSVLGDGNVERVTVEFPDSEFGPVELNWEGDHEAYSTTTWGGRVETDGDTDPGTHRYEITVDTGEDDPETVVDEFTIVPDGQQ